MQISILTSIVLLFTPLLARPNPSLSDETLSLISPLMKRDTRGWIGSHLLPGCVTKGGKKDQGVDSENNNASDGGYVVYDRPILSKGKCVEWSTATPYIGINWGSGRMVFNRVEFHANRDCSDKPRVVHIRKGDEPGACVTTEGKPWEEPGRHLLVKAVKAL